MRGRHISGGIYTHHDKEAKETPLSQIYEWIDESERRVFQLERKLRKRRILKKLFFFIPLPPETWGGETYLQLLAEEKHLAWLNLLKNILINFSLCTPL